MKTSVAMVSYNTHKERERGINQEWRVKEKHIPSSSSDEGDKARWTSGSMRSVKESGSRSLQI